MAGSLEERLADWEARLDQLEAALGPPALNGRHVLFVPSPSGYGLVEHDAATPSSGGWVKLEGRKYLVVRVGRSPLPGDRRLCWYLLAT